MKKEELNIKPRMVVCYKNGVDKMHWSTPPNDVKSRQEYMKRIGYDTKVFSLESYEEARNNGEFELYKSQEGAQIS